MTEPDKSTPSDDTGPPKPETSKRRRKAYKPHKPKRASRTLAPEEIVSDPIAEFCARVGISQSFFHKLKAQGLGPETVKLGRRTLITREASRRWLTQREAKSAA